MITQEIKDNFIQNLKALVKSNFTALDVCCFIRDNDMAQYLLRKFPLCEYDEQLNYLECRSDEEIEYVLNTPHSQYYDPDYGSSDPLCGLRIPSKDEYEKEGESFLFENLIDYDNVLSHMLFVIENEDVEIPRSEILCRSSLEKLVGGGYDFRARHIYYFETIEYNSYCFWHCWKSDAGWDYNKWKMDFNDFEGIAREYFAGYDNVRDIECHFYYDIETAYMEELNWIEADLPLSKAVFNGTEAITQLKQSTRHRLLSMAKAYVNNIRIKSQKNHQQILDAIKYCDAALSLFDIPIDVIADHLEIENPAQKDRYKDVLTTDKFRSIDKTLKEKDAEIISLKKKLNIILDTING